MKNIKLTAATVAAVTAICCASPSYARGCIAGPYLIGSQVSYTGTVTASQNVSLFAKSAIYSPNGIYKLIFQEDGNLVLYKNNTNAVWAVDVQNCLPTPNIVMRTRFQPDGNLVVYYAKQNDPIHEFPVWDTKTDGHPNARLVVQNDGNLVIYDSNNRVLWAIF